MNKVRNSNTELLRIISIILIVVSHYCVHGAGKAIISSLDISINRFILEVFKLGNLGTILFVLITGYYLIDSEKVKLKKLFHLVFQILFYSISIYLILYFIGLNSFSIKGFIKALFPITYKEYWFATSYVILYLFHPYINRLLNSFTRKKHLIFIYLMIFIFSILHTLTTSNYYGNEIVQFLMFYSIGAYFNKYPKNYFGNKKHNYKMLILSILTIIASIIVCDLIGTKIDFFNKHSTDLLNRTSPFAILLCSSLFDIFARKEEKNNRLINFIGTLMFGVYLISDNNYIRPILWNNIFKCKSYVTSPYLIIHLIVSVIITIIVCIIIEMIRKYLIEKPIFNKLDNKIDSLQEKLELKIDKIKL